MKRTALLPALILGLSLALTGCGGSDDDDKGSDDPTTAASITKPDFIEQADGICKAGNATLDAAAQALGDTPDQAAVEAFVTSSAIPTVQGEHDSIEALGTPEGDEDAISAMLDALQKGIDDLKADPGAIMTATESPFADADQLAVAYGLKECGAS